IPDQSGKFPLFLPALGQKNISDLPEAALKPEHSWKLTFENKITVLQGSEGFVLSCRLGFACGPTFPDRL
ncbi:MAG: hypothetical protein ACQEUB_13675, partial [Thermodesulfobacteriota bacterium]